MKLRLRNFMKEVGFKVVDETIYGIYDGYLVTVSDSDGAASMYIDLILPESDTGQAEAIKKIIRLNSKQYAILRTEVSNTGVLVVFPSSMSGFSKLKDFFYFFLQQLKSERIGGASVCTNCGQPISNVKILSIYGRLHSCDAACTERIIKKYNEVPHTYRTNFLSGFFGAILGAVAGLVPLFVLSRLDFYVLWCGFFVGLFAKGGYELFGGKKCAGKAVALPLLSLAVTAPCLFLIYCYKLNEIWMGRNYITNFNSVIDYVLQSLLEDPSVQKVLITDIFITFGYALLGLLLIMRFTGKTRKEEVFIV